jgi:hypothetical protein
MHITEPMVCGARHGDTGIVKEPDSRWIFKQHRTIARAVLPSSCSERAYLYSPRLLRVRIAHRKRCQNAESKSLQDVLHQMGPMGPTRIGRDLIAPEYAFLHGDLG